MIASVLHVSISDDTESAADDAKNERDMHCDLDLDWKYVVNNNDRPW
jgi:hypothetical protein